MKKTLSLFLTLIVLLSTLVSCGKSAALSYGSLSLSEDLLYYLCCAEKSSYLCEIYGVDSPSNVQDNAAIWAMKDEAGSTIADTLKEGVLRKAELLLYLEKVAIDAGLKLTDAQKSTVQQDLDNTIASFKTKSAFNETMKQYGIDYNDFYEYRLHQAQASLGSELLFGEGGSLEVTEASAKEYFENNYYTVGLIFINNKNKTYANGKTVYLPEAEKAEKTALAADLLNRLSAGEDFDALRREFSDGSFGSEDKASVTFTAGSLGIAEVEEKAASMKNGEILRIEAKSGVYLVQKRALDRAYFESEKDSIQTELEQNAQRELVTSHLDEFNVNEAFLNELSIAEIPFVV